MHFALRGIVAIVWRFPQEKTWQKWLFGIRLPLPYLLCFDRVLGFVSEYLMPSKASTWYCLSSNEFHLPPFFSFFFSSVQLTLPYNSFATCLSSDIIPFLDTVTNRTPSALLIYLPWLLS